MWCCRLCEPSTGEKNSGEEQVEASPGVCFKIKPKRLTGCLHWKRACCADMGTRLGPPSLTGRHDSTPGSQRSRMWRQDPWGKLVSCTRLIGEFWVHVRDPVSANKVERDFRRQLLSPSGLHKNMSTCAPAYTHLYPHM